MRVVEGSGEGIHIAACTLMCIQSVCYVVGVVTTEHGRSSVLYAETVSSDGCVWYVGSLSYVKFYMVLFFTSCVVKKYGWLVRGRSEMFTTLILFDSVSYYLITVIAVT